MCVFRAIAWKEESEREREMFRRYYCKSIIQPKNREIEKKQTKMEGGNSTGNAVAWIAAVITIKVSNPQHVIIYQNSIIQ